jgi:hypothetical protein
MNTNMMIKWGLIAICTYGTARFCIRQTNGFTVADVLSNRPHDSSWETRPLTLEEQQEVNEALHQPYTYFGAGGQAYVFFSQDGKYALKLLKHHRFRMPFLNQIREKKRWKRLAKQARDFSSYKIGFEQLQQETGLIYVHLNKTDHLQNQLTIKDRLNITHQLDLDSLDFLLQRRAVLVLDEIAASMEKKDLPRATEVISSVIDLVLSRCAKGIADSDSDIRTNCGFLDHRAIKIDVGKFAHVQELKPAQELAKVCEPLKQWLTDHHPVLVPILESQLKEYAWYD